MWRFGASWRVWCSVECMDVWYGIVWRFDTVWSVWYSVENMAQCGGYGANLELI